MVLEDRSDYVFLEVAGDCYLLPDPLLVFPFLFPGQPCLKSYVLNESPQSIRLDLRYLFCNITSARQPLFAVEEHAQQFHCWQGWRSWWKLRPCTPESLPRLDCDLKFKWGPLNFTTFPSVNRPSSNSWSNVVSTSGWALSTCITILLSKLVHLTASRHLVEEHHRLGIGLEPFGQLTAILVTNVARWTPY